MKSKLTSTLTVAFIGLATLSAPSAYSDGLSCSDWSFNALGCSANVESSKAPARASSQADKQQLAACSDWSFNTPGCSAYIEPTNKAPTPVASQDGKQQLACSDWSFNAPGCSAHIN